MPRRAPARSAVGCSGWQYRDWRGPVYPAGLPARDWFEHYATLFDTVEINNTFYRLPPAVDGRGVGGAGAARASSTPLKLGQFGSHRMKLRDAATLASQPPRPGASASGPHLGPKLVQLPPRWKRNVERLDEFLDGRRRRDLRWAVELRDPSWLHDDAYEVLAPPRRRPVPPRPAPRPSVGAHHRLDLRPLPRARRPEPASTTAATPGAACGRPAERLAPWLDDGCDVYAYFNNDFDGHAVTDARWLADRLLRP